MHLLLDFLYQLVQFLCAHGFQIFFICGRCFLCRLGNRDQVTHCLFDGGRRNAMFLVVGLLNLTAAVRLINSHPHRIGNGIRVHDDMALRISGRTANGLDQGSL